MEFVFESSPWERYLQELQPGQSISASYMLTLLEGEDEETVEQTFALMEEKQLRFDLSDLPRPNMTGENGLRLRREAELAKQEKFWLQLEETDPLRLYLEELENGSDDFAESLRQVAQMATEFTGRGVLLLDLIQEGSLGLWRATQTGEEPRQAILFALQKAAIQQARADGVGQKLRTALEDYRSVDEKLLTELGRNPTVEEIAEQLHMDAESAALLADMLDTVRRMDRVKAPAQPEKETEEEDQAVENTAYFQMRQRISELLSTLSEDEATLLRLRFGLEGGMPLTPEQAGRQLGLTPEEVVKIEAAALLKLRNEG